MKYSRLILLCAFFLSFVMTVYAQVDSLSYSLGFATSSELLSGDNDLFTSDTDAKDYISGIEKGVPSEALVDDTCYVKDYSMGVMQGNYIANYLAQICVDWKPRVRCIIDGVRKVADKSVSLPADTIGMMERLTVLTDTAAINRMTDTEICNLYVEYGIFNGLQLITDRKGSEGIEADNMYSVHGIIDLLESMDPTSAYDLGLSSGKLLVISKLAFPGFKIDDYINGAKAGFRLSEPLLSRQEVEAVIEAAFDKRKSVDTEREKKKIKSGDKEYTSGDICSVNWNVSFLSVPSPGSVPSSLMADYNRAISRIMERFGIKEMIQFRFSEFMKFFREPVVGRDELMRFIKSLNDSMAQGYKLICFQSVSGEWTIGLASEENMFNAQIGNVAIDIYDESQPVIGLSFVFSDRVEQWTEFTKANIGKPVVMEINGEAIMAPLINSEITRGACMVTVYSLDEFNRLLNL